MKKLGVLVGWLVLASSLHAGATLKQARTEWLRGNYGEARESFLELAKNPKLRVGATLGLSKAWQSSGDYDKALQVVDDLLADDAKNPDLLARRSEVLFLRGRWDDAQKSAETTLELQAGNFLAHWVLGQLWRDRGDWAKADEHFVWFIRTYSKRQTEDNEISDPDELMLVGLAALERARYKHLGDQYQFVLTEIFNDTAKKDKTYWPAEYEAGNLLLEKHNKPGATKALDRALAINPRAAQVFVCKGQMAMAGFEMKEAEQFAEQALKINPSLVIALCLQADVYWFSGEIDKTLVDLAKARVVNPRDEGTLARLAACHYMQKKDADLKAVVADVEKHNAKPHVFYTELAARLEERKQYADAEKFYKTALAAEPKLPDAQTGLGMLYMRLGREAEARKLLDASFDADNFNVRVHNTLKVLDHLEKYETLKTPHFIVRFDKKNDEVLANYMALYLESIYKELATQFDHQPKEPILIEVFNKHEMFSGRVVALPDLHTIGACTGPLFAMVSPRDKSKVIGKPFNWNRVIRHEMVHVFNLNQTNYQVPHWLTEGLAVRYEGSTPPPSWSYLLAEKFHANDLLNLDTILLGFVRPRSPAQWQQAYLQSLLYVEYLTKTHGEKAVGKMLAAFAEGLETGAALEKVCNVKKADFEKGYREFLAERVKNTPLKAQPKAQSVKTLKEAFDKNPADNDLGAQLAERYLQLGKKKDATEIVDKILRVDSKHPGAAYVKAMLLLEAGDFEIAYSVLDAVVNDATKDVKPLKLLAKIQFEGKKFKVAAETLERVRKLDPNDVLALVQLGKAYTKLERDDKLMEVFEELAKADPDEMIPRKRLAKHHAEKKNHAEAERFARMGLEIDVLDADCQRILLDALAAQNKNDEAAQLKKIFESE